MPDSDNGKRGFRAWPITWRAGLSAITGVAVVLSILAAIRPWILRDVAQEVSDRIQATQRPIVEQIARDVAQRVIEENVPRAHEIARRVAREEVAGYSKERRRELDQVHAAMIRLTDEVRQMRDDLRALRADVRDN